MTGRCVIQALSFGPQMITSHMTVKQAAYTRSSRGRRNDYALHYNWGPRWPPNTGNSHRNCLCHTYQETDEQEVESRADWKIY